MWWCKNISCKFLEVYLWEKHSYWYLLIKIIGDGLNQSTFPLKSFLVIIKLQINKKIKYISYFLRVEHIVGV